ncbi:MAG: oligosaccharide flippase family protein [Bacteroidales bacterium]|nr:oligosaccharide flippase family protein [Bacteroidales bacterium]
MLQKKLLSGLFWVLLLNLLIKPFWILGIEVGMQNAVGHEEYGFYFAIFNLAYIFNILLDLGITNYNTRNIAQHPKLVDKHFSSILTIKAILLGLYLVVTFTVGLLKGYQSRQFTLLAFLCFNQFLSSFILFLRSNFEGLLLFKWDSVISILDRVIMIIICGCLLWLPNHPDIKIEYFVYAQTAAYLTTAVVALAVLLAHLKRRGTHRNSQLPIGTFCYPETGESRAKCSKTHRVFSSPFSWPFFIAILKQSAPFALLVLLMASYNRIDPVLLEDLAPNGTFQAGIYAGAFRLLDALTMIAYLVSVPLLPIYSKLTRSLKVSETPRDTSQLASVTRLMFSLIMVFAITAAITFSSMSEELMDLLFNEHIEELSSVFCILIFSIIPISVTYIFGTLLTADGRLKRLNILATCSLGLNILINLILIPRYGAVGSACASLAAQSFIAIAQMLSALRQFNIIPHWNYILKLTLFTLSIIICNLVLRQIDAAWLIWLIAAMVVALAAALLLRLIDIKEIVTIIKENE